MSPPQIAMYDATGGFLQLYDNDGDGPGPFRMAPLLFAVPRQHGVAFDRERVVRFDAMLRHIDTRNLRQPRVASKAVVLASGSVVIDMKEAAPEGGFFSVSVMDTAGLITQRLERESDQYGHTVIGLLPESTVAVSGGQGLVYSTRQDGDGHVITTIERLQTRRPCRTAGYPRGAAAMATPRRRRYSTTTVPFMPGCSVQR